MNIFKITLISAALVAPTGCAIAPGPQLASLLGSFRRYP